tara:strand:- start:45 stop:713 length:669 start_codon:yes stop_codon:yes gene_type:complete
MIEIVLDTETTGLSVKEGHRIVEIGCIELNDLVPTKKIFHFYLNPERSVSQEALKIHGYTNEFLSDKKKFIEIADEFLEFIKDKKVIIHNADFDIAHINNELLIAGKEKITKVNIVDTLDIARNKFPGSAISLDALCKKFRIDNSRREKHTALVDCELLAKVYINLLDQKEPKLNFNYINEIKKNENIKKTNNYAKKIISPSAEEIKKHIEFVKKDLKKNFF